MRRTPSAPVSDLSSGSAWWSTTRTVEPRPDDAAVLQSDHEAFVALYRALAPWNTARRGRIKGSGR